MLMQTDHHVGCCVHATRCDAMRCSLQADRDTDRASDRMRSPTLTCSAEALSVPSANASRARPESKMPVTFALDMSNTTTATKTFEYDCSVARKGADNNTQFCVPIVAHKLRIAPGCGLSVLPWQIFTTSLPMLPKAIHLPDDRILSRKLQTLRDIGTATRGNPIFLDATASQGLDMTEISDVVGLRSPGNHHPASFA